MFNDLNQPNQQAAGTPPVDDIFAETDKSVEAKNFSGYYANTNAAPTPGVSAEIETQKAGLSAAEDLPTSSKGKILKVGLITLLILLLIGLCYLIYVKFLTGQEEVPVVNTPVATTTEQTPVATVTPVITEVPVVTSTPEVATSTDTTLTDTDSDGLTNEEEGILGTDINLKDTDNDGLSDYDEVKLYNTSALLTDTDKDGLPDYDEIKIYKTDANKADTDGDGHSDGEEVKNGYNPLGSGKMVDASKATSTTSVK
jgi:hypothetical protein